MALGKLPLTVTLIDRKNHHTFQPLLYQVALAVLSPADIAQPIRSILRSHENTEVLMDEVVAIDLRRAAGQPVQAARASPTITSSWRPAPRIPTSATMSGPPLAPGLKSIEDATEIRRRVLLAFELAERQKVEQGWHPPLNFVVIGGGPTGVELAGAIADISQQYMTKDFRHIDPRKSRVLLLDGGPRVLAAYPEDLAAKAEKILGHLSVEVHTGCQVMGVGPGWVDTGGPNGIGRVSAAVTVWAAGVQASPLGKLLGVPLDKRGCVLVDDQLNPEGMPNVFVIGDLAHFEQDGRQVPGVAQPAMQMGDHVGRMIRADLDGKPRKAFRYFDKGDMATIGRNSAIAKVEWPFKAHLSGFLAWATWATVHIFFLIGFRNRLRVAASWFWTYLTFNRGARLITGDQRLPGWKEQMAEGADQMREEPVEARKAS